MSEPIRHHYVPQFIIRNFRVDTSVNYWNFETQNLEKRNPVSILMKPNLYKDIKNHPDNIMAIEKKFSQFENEISNLISTKFLSGDSIELTRNQNERLRKFLFLLSFRSENRKNQYINANFSPSTKTILDKYTIDNDYVDLWLREINAILDCKTIEDLECDSNISSIIKMDVKNELKGYYMTVIESRGQDFLLTDIYPTTEVFPIGFEGANYHMHQMFPISPNRCILLNSVIGKKGVAENELYRRMDKISKIKGNLLKEPKAVYKKIGVLSSEDVFTFNVVKAYQNDVIYINHLLINEAKVGIVFNNSSRIIESIDSYTKLDVVTKNELNKFLQSIK